MVVHSQMSSKILDAKHENSKWFRSNVTAYITLFENSFPCVLRPSSRFPPQPINQCSAGSVQCGVRPRGRGKTRGGVKTRGGGKTPGGGKRGEDLIDDEDMSEESSDAPEAEGSEDSDSSSSGIDSNLASVSELSALIKPKVSRKKY